MVRKVFFRFKYENVSRAMIVQNSATIKGAVAAGFIEKADFEEVEADGDDAIQGWIDGQLVGTSITAVLVGAKTCGSRWVKYETAENIKRGNGPLGIDISKIKNLAGDTSAATEFRPGNRSTYGTMTMGTQTLATGLRRQRRRSGDRVSVGGATVLQTACPVA